MSSDDSQKDRSFLARYGATILSGGVAPIPRALYRYQRELGLTPQHIWFISAILAHKWDEDLPYPSLKQMAAQTGVSEQQLHNYKKKLVEDGWLTIITRHNYKGGQEANSYDFATLFGALEELIRRDKRARQEAVGREEDGGREGGLNPSLAPGLNSPSAPGLNPSWVLKEAEDQEAVEKEADQISKDRNKDSLHKQTDLSQRNEKLRLQSFVDNAASRRARGSGTDLSAPTGFAALGEVLASRQPSRPAAAPRSSTTSRGRPPKAPPYIEAVMRDISARLHDEEHTQANITRAARLWKASGLPEERFVHDVLYQARSLTQAQGTIQKPATAGGGLRNRVPYFFAVVEDLLGLKEERADG